jgi:exopolyphosphatase/pppGpp-phosphohydrolase
MTTNSTLSRIEALRTQIAQTQAQITQAERAAEEAAAALKEMGWDADEETAEEFAKRLAAEAELAKQAEEAALVTAEQAAALLPKG